MSEFYIVIEHRPEGVQKYKVPEEVYHQYCLIGKRLEKVTKQNKKLKQRIKEMETQNEEKSNTKTGI